MASATLKGLYRTARRADVGCIVGEHALSAWRAAHILRQWDALEALDLVRLRSEFDNDCDPTEFGGSADDEAYGSIGEYTLYPLTVDPDAPRYAGDGDDDWQHADSVWGHVGYRDVLDWRENAYIIDIMEETIDAFRDAWKAHVRAERDRRAGVCPTCHGTGRQA